MIAQFVCLKCGMFFVQSVQDGYWARCPDEVCSSANVRIVPDYRWRLGNEKKNDENDEKWEKLLDAYYRGQMTLTRDGTVCPDGKAIQLLGRLWGKLDD